VTGQWNAAVRRELIKIYNARLGMGLVATVGARPGPPAMIRYRRLSHLQDDLVGGLLPGAPHPSHAAGPAGHRRQEGPQ
jgi:hypothetical protein